jgi:hypothetical protein
VNEGLRGPGPVAFINANDGPRECGQGTPLYREQDLVDEPLPPRLPELSGNALTKKQGAKT